jgi:hypothetical protein
MFWVAANIALDRVHEPEREREREYLSRPRKSGRMLVFTRSEGQPGCMDSTQIDAPDLRETPGGWLAVAVDSPRIAVVAATRDEALAKFQAERAEWRELIAQAQQEHAIDAG